MLQRSLVSHTFGSIHSTTTTTSTMNPLNALFLAVALTPALVSAAPQPTFGALFRHKEQKKEEKKEEKKGMKDGGKDVVYIVRPSYEVHQTYQPLTQHHGYGAPVTGYGAPYPVMASTLVGPQYGEPVEGYGYYA